jgi:hypothetical protein
MLAADIRRLGHPPQTIGGLEATIIADIIDSTQASL